MLPVLSKVLERVVHTKTSVYLNRLGLLYKHQYGFRRGRSTVKAVGHLNNSMLDDMDGGKVTGMLFLDIVKAFDSINHKILPEHFDVFNYKMSQQHGYNTRNGYMPKVIRPRTE